MIEPGTVELNRECNLRKRCSSFEQNDSPKRPKNVEGNDISSTDTDTESKDSLSDNESLPDDESNLSTDQSRSLPVVYIQTGLPSRTPTLSRHSKNVIKQFRDLCNQNQRKTLVWTSCTNNSVDQNKKLRCELKQTFDRNDLFKEGYVVLSDETFPFHSLCYMVSTLVFHSANILSVLVRVYGH